MPPTLTLGPYTAHYRHTYNTNERHTTPHHTQQSRQSHHHHVVTLGVFTKSPDPEAHNMYAQILARKFIFAKGGKPKKPEKNC